MKKFVCHCEQEIDLDIPDLLDLDANPLIMKEIIDGSYLTTTCPKCGTKLRPEFSLRVQSAKNKLDAFVLTELDRLSVYREKADAPRACELLVGFPELMERLKIMDAGLDAAAIEVIKYYVQGKAEETESGADINVFFNSLKDGKLVFHILGFASGDAGILNIPRDTYESTRKDLPAITRKKPFSDLSSGNYHSIKKLAFLDDEE